MLNINIYQEDTQENPQGLIHARREIQENNVRHTGEHKEYTKEFKGDWNERRKPENSSRMSEGVIIREVPPLNRLMYGNPG